MISLSFSMKFSMIQRCEELSLFIFLSCSSFQLSRFMRFSFLLIRLSRSRSKSVSRKEGGLSSTAYPFFGECIQFWMYVSYLAILFSRCSRYIFTSCSSLMWLRMVASSFCVCASSDEQLWMLTKFSEMTWIKYCTRWQVSRDCEAVTAGFQQSFASSVKSYSAGNMASRALRMLSWVCLLTSSPLFLGEASRVWNYSIIISALRAGEKHEKAYKTGHHGHSRSIFRLLLQLLVEFPLLHPRLPFSFCSLKFQKQRTGQNSCTDRSEFQQLSIWGILRTLSRSIRNFSSLPTSQGKAFSRRLIASQTTKSRMVISERNQGSSLHSFSQRERTGLILFSQQQAMHFFFSISQVGRVVHLAPSIAKQRSVLLRRLSTNAFSCSVRPKRSCLLAFSMMQVAMAMGPDVTKSPSWRKGRSRKIQSLASLSLNLAHQSGSKKRSRQGRRRYSQRSLQTCPLARKGQQARVSGSLQPSRSIILCALCEFNQCLFSDPAIVEPSSEKVKIKGLHSIYYPRKTLLPAWTFAELLQGFRV